MVVFKHCHSAFTHTLFCGPRICSLFILFPHFSAVQRSPSGFIRGHRSSQQTPKAGTPNAPPPLAEVTAAVVVFVALKNQLLHLCARLCVSIPNRVCGCVRACVQVLKQQQKRKTHLCFIILFLLFCNPCPYALNMS